MAQGQKVNLAHFSSRNSLGCAKKRDITFKFRSFLNFFFYHFIFIFRLPWKFWPQLDCKYHLNLSKCDSLPLHSNPSQLANDFGKFFRDKINSIRLEIARQCCSSGVSDSLLALYGPSFSEFRLLSETEVLEIIKSSTKTTRLLVLLTPFLLPNVLMYYLLQLPN